MASLISKMMMSDLMSDIESTHSRDGGGYPTAITYASSMNTSSMLLVREVAMMIIMDRLTDKPDWHVKVFDDTITNKWIEEALALPVEPLYDDIVPVGPRHARPKKLTSILDRGCLEYVSIVSLLMCGIMLMLSVYQRTPCQGQVLHKIRDCPNSGCHGYSSQIRQYRRRRAPWTPPCCLRHAATRPEG